MTAIENSRAEFEEFVSSSPFEYSTDRYPDSAAFPGTYKSLRVDLAWNAWCEARKEVVSLLEANSELNGDYLAAIAEAEQLRAQLPDGMKHCTILFKECEKGHGWLTATNWVQHCCPTCEADELRAEVVSLKLLRDKWQEIANRWLAVSNDQELICSNLRKERDELAAKLALVIECGDSCCDEYCKDEWELAANAGADKAIAKIKADAVRDAFLQLASELRSEKSTGITIKGLIHEAEIKANQIEGGE